MRLRFTAVLPRFVVVASVALLASATLTLAATTGSPTPAAPTPAAPAQPTIVVVPDVRQQAYVFAKGTLEDAGFAWRVVGPVAGYAANPVIDQSPSAGTRLVDTGSPTITLRLSRNASYTQVGNPENASPYPGSRLVLADLARATVPVIGKPAKGPKPAAKPAAKPKRKATAARRPPAFLVPGAPKEPLTEISLPARAKQLAAWLETHPTQSDANIEHWLYQHSWLVAGAKFGWWQGDEALEVLIRIDRRAQQLWGIGSRSEAVARQALAEVQARSG